MHELVDFLVKNIIPEGTYEIVFMEYESNVEIKIYVDKNNVAKLIGKFGRIAKSIRNIVKAITQDTVKKYDVSIEERE